MQLTIKVGGNESKGSIKYIEDYGFYEGGLNNEYRIDPHILVAMLTNRINNKCIEILKEKEILKVNKLEKNLQQLEQHRKEVEKKFIDSSDKQLLKLQEDRSFIISSMEKIQLQIKCQQEESKRFLDSLLRFY